MTAILHTVPLSPVSVAVFTIYIPLGTRFPFKSLPSHWNEPPVLLPCATSTPFVVVIFTSALKESPTTVMSPV